MIGVGNYLTPNMICKNTRLKCTAKRSCAQCNVGKSSTLDICKAQRSALYRVLMKGTTTKNSGPDH